MAPKKVTNAGLQKMVVELTKRVEELEQRLGKKPANAVSINKVESFNGEEEPEPTGGLKMAYQDKIVSMRNAIKILNPKLIVDGRHAAKNISAVCGFQATEEMVADAYELLEKGK